MSRRHVFIISYGRTGSTLLMALLSNHERVLVRGENNMLMRHLQRAIDALEQKYDPDANVTSNAYYGSHLHKDEFLVPMFGGFVETYLAGDLRIEDYDVLGYKGAEFDGRVLDCNGAEVRDDTGGIKFDDNEIIRDLTFMRRLFPDCVLVFNTRAPEEVIRSDFQIGRRTIDIEEFNALYERLAQQFDGVVCDYSDVVEFGPKTQEVFARLGITPDPNVVSETLFGTQGYVRLALGSRVTRVPYFVRPLPHDSIDFFDIQVITLFDSRIATLSGGLIVNRPVTFADWSVDNPNSRVVRFKGGNPSGYYAEQLPDPAFQTAGFALEVILPDGEDTLVVNLFGQPALRIHHVSKMPVVRAAR